MDRLDPSEVRALYAEGLSAQVVADRAGVSKKTVLRWLKQQGVERRSLRKVTPEVEARIVEMAAAGSTVKQAETELGLEATTLREYAAKNGVEFTDRFHTGFITTWNGYKMLRAPEHPAADSKGYVREHVLVAERCLGRFLYAHEVVHHKDGDKQNNAPENLEVLLRSEHARHHATVGDTGWAKYHANRKI